MSALADESDAKTIKAWHAWLDGAEVSDIDKAIEEFLRWRAEKREQEWR